MMGTLGYVLQKITIRESLYMYFAQLRYQQEYTGLYVYNHAYKSIYYPDYILIVRNI